MSYEEGVRFADQSVWHHWLELNLAQQSTVSGLTNGDAIVDIRFGHDQVEIDFKHRLISHDSPIDTIVLDDSGQVLA